MTRSPKPRDAARWARPLGWILAWEIWFAHIYFFDDYYKQGSAFDRFMESDSLWNIPVALFFLLVGFGFPIFSLYAFFENAGQSLPSAPEGGNLNAK